MVIELNLIQERLLGFQSSHMEFTWGLVVVLQIPEKVGFPGNLMSSIANIIALI